MIKALLLIFDPIATWERIFRARHTLGFILSVYLLPLLLLTSFGEGYGLVHWGKWRGMNDTPHFFSIGEAAIYEAVQLLLSLTMVFIGAELVKAIGETFHGRHTFTQAFTAVAYGLSPFFLLRLGDACAREAYWAPWVIWAIGMILSTGVLYQGVPRMMEPDPPHAFGLFLMTSLLLSLITGLVRFVSVLYLQGKFPKLETFVSGLGQRLPF